MISLLITALMFNPTSFASKHEILTEQKDVIWGFDFLDKDRIIFTERSGKIKILNLVDKKVTAVTGAPLVWSKGQGGMLDVRVNPKNKNQIFITYAEPKPSDTATTAVASADLNKNELQNLKKIFSANAPSDETIHFGSRLEFDDKDHIYFTIGDRNSRAKVQDLAFHNGKTIRLKLDGSIPKDNPFVSNKKALPEIWSYGHRSPQGLVRNQTTGELWLAEMGPRGGDEVNLIEPGKNYGWPDVTFGKEYWGPSIGTKTKAGTEQPFVYWVPSISPSAMTVHKGNLYLACLSGTHIRKLVIANKKVTKEEKLLEVLEFRFRNLRSGPDGYLYFSTDGGHIGRLLN